MSTPYSDYTAGGRRILLQGCNGFTFNSRFSYLRLVCGVGICAFNANGTQPIDCACDKGSGFKLIGTRRLAKNQGNEFANL